MITLDQLNALSRGEFVRQLKDIAEHSPWVAEKVRDHHPFKCKQDLIKLFKDTILSSSHDQKLDLILAHPDLADRIGLADADTLAELSKKEQYGAGLDQLSEDEYKRFYALNAEYRKKFAFPFIIAVRAVDKEQILAIFQQRVVRSYDEEFQEALKQILMIIQFRLEDMVQS
ncbi:MAG: 2-oxo-4-hydroxy-4-carboxy-5-ureidoimidazoline decarboxylase [Pseudomonadota bacterium]